MSAFSNLTGIAHNELACQLLHAMPEAVFLVDADSLVILAVNPLAEELTGLRQDELLNQPLDRFFTTQAGRDFSSIFETGEAAPTAGVPLLCHQLSDSDHRRPLSATGQLLTVDEQPLGMVTFKTASASDENYFEPTGEIKDYDLRDGQIATQRDATQLKQARLKFEQVSEQFRYLFDNSPDAIFVESPEGFVLDANQAACDLHKLTRDQLIGQNVLSLIPPDDRPAASTRSSSLATGEISEFESHSMTRDGEVIPVGIRNSPITYDGGPAILLHVRDITQQKLDEELKREQERQLAHVSRLTMMGQLVAGIAHEIRQPLWSLSTFADVVVESLNRPDFAERLPQICDVAGKVVAEARRVNAITTRMFSFARKGTPERTLCDIREIVNDAVELTAGRAQSSRIRTTLTVEDNLPEINCDRVLIEQTFANLLHNAYTALAAQPSDARQVSVEIFLDAEDSDYVTASVRDNGPGLPDGIVPEQLFEGFFTTGQSGLGIGLALSRSFVEDHGGAIRAEPLPAGGMEFVFTLRVDGGISSDAD